MLAKDNPFQRGLYDTYKLNSTAALQVDESTAS